MTEQQKATTTQEPPVAGGEFSSHADDHGTSAEFQGSPEGGNDLLDRDDQAVAVEILSAFPHKVMDDGVVVLPDEAESQTKGGLIIPDVAKKRIQTGRVLAMGPGKVLQDGTYPKPQFKVGSKVLYGRYAGEQVDLKHAGRDIVLMRHHDVRLVLGS